MSGGVDADAANLFDTGPLLLSIAQACLKAGATPILAHHSTKALKPGEPMRMEDLAFAGIAEFMRQWILVNRLEPFDPDTGTSKLIFSAGGSAGQCGEWFVYITEGVLGDDMNGRKWDVTVLSRALGKQTIKDKAAEESERKAAQRAKDQDAKVLKAIDDLMQVKMAPAPAGRRKSRKKPEPAEPTPPTKNQIRSLAKVSGEAVELSLERLKYQGIVEEVEITVRSGRGNKATKPALGYRRKRVQEECA